MSMSLLEPGDRLLVVHRRLFERDEARFFLGEVEAFESGVIRINGYSFVRDSFLATVRRKAEPRTKLLSLTSGTLLVYVLPRSIDIGQTELRCDDAEMLLTDGDNFSMNLSEWGYDGHD
ncbi:MAG: hypothetical protein ACYTGL_18490 [Planctomycetota bacterium]|jgi:hypothetical protein